MLSNSAAPFGFRIVGSCHSERRLVNADAAFLAYSQCDDRAEVNREAYLSAFRFGSAFRELLDKAGSPKGYSGDCWSPWLWLDIDRDELDAATIDARRLAATLVERFAIDDDTLLLFFSGRKGFHIGLPLAVCEAPGPSRLFHAYCRKFAENIATISRVAIDTGVYDRVRAFRAPNSYHAKTGRYKRFLAFNELMQLKPSRIVELAAQPEPFDLPATPSANDQAVQDWLAAVALVDALHTASTKSRSLGLPPSALNRATLEFIRDGADNGDRHRMLFSAAANLAEFNCSFALAWALLSESALDSGLPPSEVRRQIECGLQHRGNAQ